MHAHVYVEACTQQLQEQGAECCPVCRRPIRVFT
jgi:hypothetical protein